MTPALQRAYADALSCQDATNGAALITSLARHMPALWDEVRAKGEGTDAMNHHPVIGLFLSKLCSLYGDLYDPGPHAWVICESMAKVPTNV